MFKAAGKYDFMDDMVCNIVPQITTVIVEYGDTIGTNTLDHEAVVEPVGRPAGLSAVTTILNMVFFSQAISTNIMGDELDSFIAESDGLNYQDETILAYTVRDGPSCYLLLIGSQEEYVSAVAEYSSSVSYDLCNDPSCFDLTLGPRFYGPVCPPPTWSSRTVFQRT
jgi:hypothetical protein